ncbi:hypothetical protein R4P64_31175 [Rhodococcus sp. IEGM 1366]|uniref:hypothetical protein n=1 Tax=Rhodococcus sp. IEGM 1366 TaxID=3082223 RepID=UPI002954BC79|nr:hypothetical protein [Rhodococcus sp. IEGM 1366]MDV8070987.1 hypothetical protein [Rhodococcus sp. IEGM 1366]
MTTTNRAPDPISTKPWELHETREILERWLSNKVGEPTEILGLDHPVGAGISNETVMFSARWSAAASPGRHETRLLGFGGGVGGVVDHDVGPTGDQSIHPLLTIAAPKGARRYRRELGEHQWLPT